MEKREEKVMISLLLLSPLLLAQELAQELPQEVSLSQRAYGIDRYRDFFSLPLLEEGVRAGYVSSFDRTGGNDDGFSRKYSSLRLTRTGEEVLLELTSPGVIYSMWFTGPGSGAPLDCGKLRFYFDGARRPRLTIDANDLFSGKDPRFPAPLVAGPDVSTGGYVSYVPIPFSKSILVTASRRPGFYHIFYHVYTRGRPVKSWTGKEDLSFLKRLFSRPGEARLAAKNTQSETGTKKIEAGENSVLIRLTGGAGIISGLRLAPGSGVTKEILRHTFIRIYFDGAREPAVDVPVGHFFGSGLGEAKVRSLLFGMTPGGPYYCNFPMPFWSEAKIVLRNDTAEDRLWGFGVWWIPLPKGALPRGTFGYFHAQWREENPTETGKDYRILFARGTGVFVGNVLTVEVMRPENKQWWEGDARLYVDGCRTPILHGTGHEDEYHGGWSSTFLKHPFTLPLHGEPKTGRLTDVGGQLNGDCTMYRIFPGIPFSREILYGTEHGFKPDQNYHYSSVAFFYGVPEVRMIETDRVVTTKPQKHHKLEPRRPPEIYDLESSFVGDFDDVLFKGRVRKIHRRVQFAVNIDPKAQYVVVRQLFDHSVPNQWARVYVDLEPAGTWYRPGVNRTKRWCELDAMLPPGLTKGKSTIRIKIVPKSEWTESVYTILSVMPAGKGKRIASMSRGETEADPKNRRSSGSEKRGK